MYQIFVDATFSPLRDDRCAYGYVVVKKIHKKYTPILMGNEKISSKTSIEAEKNAIDHSIQLCQQRYGKMPDIVISDCQPAIQAIEKKYTNVELQWRSRKDEYIRIAHQLAKSIFH